MVLERPPQPLDEDVVLNAPATVHANSDVMVFEQINEDLGISENLAERVLRALSPIVEEKEEKKPVESPEKKEVKGRSA